MAACPEYPWLLQRMARVLQMAVVGQSVSTTELEEAAMMAALMLSGEDNPTLARDTMFSVIMIVLTGIVGITLLVGAIKNDLQEFNLSGACLLYTSPSPRDA